MRETTARSYHHGDLRRVLIETALTMLAADQNWNFTLREVARQAGVSHGAPYKHFRDKDALLRHLAKIGFERLAAIMTDAIAPPDRPARTKFLHTAEAYIAFAQDQPGLYRLMFSSDADKSVDPDLNETALKAFDILLRLLEEGQRAGSFRTAPITAQAAASWAQVHGLALLLLNGQLTEEKVGPAPVPAALHILLEGLSS
ncbi:TetR family transcriptional regulator [Gluconacetobacter liquefaciens]|uniref:TetR family transcriptional regulator n=1 Tax=Gluconacetobacter liquefaciens TaxID=89584 RepID=A0A370FYF0_GLULI|nr:TetR/AcrR family transcriptional regulator [Gluconacetobacter liquefaciens]MBB2188176.1 TetR/AcrR family transcriptional regulator [Gluconacetobacter liquefaciens]RDI34152.1 TetR family transcriptional regulator [Gluconacetobacter liquefaciens]GBR05439.1 TetR family transcriptional regulator [Gluconacetobacter liquefaciens NRIC 0522]GEB38979.1 TetR family transcriptional regulator [Gluconacetobacter liquefaciens]